MGRPFVSLWRVVWHRTWREVALYDDDALVHGQTNPFAMLTHLREAGGLTTDLEHLLLWACRLHQLGLQETELVEVYGMTEAILRHASLVSTDREQAVLHAMDALRWESPWGQGEGPPGSRAPPPTCRGS